MKFVASALLASLFVHTFGATVAASSVFCITANGLRKGATASRYANIEGAKNGKYACISSLEFSAATLKDAPISHATLSVAQSNARFSKDGSVTILLCKTYRSGLDWSSLKFDAQLGSAGLNRIFGPTMVVATYKFVNAGADKHEIDKIDFAINPAALKILSHWVKSKGQLRLIMLPADLNVAATLSGIGNSDHGKTVQPPLLILN